MPLRAEKWLRMWADPRHTANWSTLLLIVIRQLPAHVSALAPVDAMRSWYLRAGRSPAHNDGKVQVAVQSEQKIFEAGVQ